MRKLILTLVAVAAACGVSQAEIVQMATDNDYQVFAISANGQWAVGMQGDGTGDMYTFRWNLLSNQIEMSDVDSYCGTSISDEGVYCGAFLYTDALGRSTHQPGWWDGQWHLLEVPGVSITDAIDGSITPDGRTMAISIESPSLSRGNLIPAVWRDGAFQYTLAPSQPNANSRAYCVSDDGSLVGGWTDTYNRQTCYWAGNGEATLIDDYKAMFAEAIHFSGDGKKLLWYGGWDSTKPEPGVMPCIYGLYDMATGEKQKFPALSEVGDAFSTHAMTDDLTIIGEYGDFTPVVIKDGVTTPLNDWLNQNYDLDLSEIPELQNPDGNVYVFRGQAISRDGKTLGLLYYGADNLMHSLILRLDADYGDPAPVAVAAEQLPAVGAVHLSWKLPYGMPMDKVEGFNVYRDGQKIATGLAPTVEDYYDGGLQPGSYAYEVSLSTAAGESSRVGAEAVVAERQPEAPQALEARQRGYNSAVVVWEAPETNLIDRRYYDNQAPTEGFGASQLDLTMETAVMFPAGEMAMYSGSKITSVAFWPMSPQRNMGVTLYVRNGAGKLVKIAEKKLSNDDLEFGQRNVVAFDKPIDVPAGDLYVAASAKIVDANNGGNVFGMEWGRSVPGRSDLLRRVMLPEEDFGSLREMSAENGVMNVSWKLDLILTPDGAKDDIDQLSHYEVDGQRVDGNSYVTGPMDDGVNAVGVTAVYADGRRSPEATAQVAIKASRDKATAVDSETIELTVDNAEFTATWEEPLDHDATALAYHHGNVSDISVSAPEENNFNLLAGVEFPADKLRTYQGYEIRSVRFMPMCEATYTVKVQRNDEVVAEQDMDEDDLKLGEWNTLVLAQPVEVEPGMAYVLLVQCVDVEDNGAPLAVERGGAVTGLSDLIDYGYGWSTLEEATAIPLTWLIDAQLVSPQGLEFPSPLYKFYVDNRVAGAGWLDQPAITAPVTMKGERPVVVGVSYDGAKEVYSAERYFDFGQEVGVEDVAEGESLAGDVYNLQGMRVMRSATAADLRSLPSGVYVHAGRKVKL